MCCAALCCVVLCCVQVRKVPGDHDKRVADLLELVQLTGLGDRCAGAGMQGSVAPWHSTEQLSTTQNRQQKQQH